MLRPYCSFWPLCGVYHKNPVEVIRHRDESIEIHGREMLGDL